jgi:glycosyltransferase involved in cell wall biosynthesis
VGGAERAVYQLVREQLYDPSLAPALLFAQGRGLYWEYARTLGCPVITLELPHGHALRDLRRSTDAMRDFDLHHFHSAEPLLMSASARCGGTRRVYTHRGGIIDYPFAKRVQYQLAGALLRRFFHGFSGNTGHAARCAAAIYDVPVDRFRVTYNCLEVGLLAPSRTAEAVRDELGIAPSEFVLGTAANLKTWKRIDRLIDAVAALPRRTMRLVIVGDGQDRERLAERAHQLGVTANVVFAGLQQRAADYIQAMDVFCLPSMGLESFGNAAVEAMALGIPTIVFSDGGGLVEHIEDGKTGFIVDSQAELEQTLEMLIQNMSIRRRVGGEASAAVRKRYAPPQAAAAFRALYSEALADSAHGSLDGPGGI